MATPVLSTLPQVSQWAGLKIIGMGESERHLGDKLTVERRYYIASLKSDARQFGQAVRGHWGIENSLHWVLDATLREDECLIRRGKSAENFCTLRHFAFNLLKQEKTKRPKMMKKKILLIIVFILCPSVLLHAQTAGPEPVIRVTLLGTGVPLFDPVAYLASGRVTAGLLIQAGSERMLFDCGQGVVTRLLQSGGPDAADPNVAVDKIFISHLHSDHIAELPSLYAYGWIFRRDKPLRVWGPRRSQNQPVGTVAMMRSLRRAFASDFLIRCCLFTNAEENLPISGVRIKNNVFNLTPGVAYDQNGVTVTAFRVDHHPVKPVFGFRIDHNGKSVVYSGDTTVSENLIEHSRGVDVLIHEVYGFPRDISPGIFDYHTSPEDAAGIFNSTLPTMAVYTHIANPTTDDDLVARTRAAGYAGPLTVGLDLMQIAVMPDGTINIIPPPAGAAGAP